MTTSSDVAQPPEQYVHDPALMEQAVALVDAAYGQAHEWRGIGDRITQEAAAHGLEQHQPLVRELALALSYVLKVETGYPPECKLRPVNGGPPSWPTAIADVSPDVVTLWRAVAAGVEHPQAKAHYNDLLFVRRDGNVGHAARQAIDSYMAWAEQRSELDLEVALSLVRSWELARKIKDAQREAHVRGRMLSAAETSMAQSPPVGPGGTLRLLAALAVGPSRSSTTKKPSGTSHPDLLASRIDGALNQALNVYRDGNFVSQITSFMRSRTVDADETEKINRLEVQAYLDDASVTTQYVRQAHLQQAIATANRYGLTDLARQATADLQNIQPSDLGFATMVTPFELPQHEVEKWLVNFTYGPDWRHGLTFFTLTDCPTGKKAELEAVARSIAGASVMLSVLPTSVATAEGLPKKTANTDEERRAHLLAKAAHIRAGIEGALLARGLQRLASTYGMPTEDDLVVLLSANGQMDQRLSRSLARAFRHFWNEDYESCVHVVVPKIEAAARALLRELDEDIYRIEAGKDPGGYVGLYTLVRKLEEIALDESWAYFLLWLLVDPFGPSIRNDVAHGLALEMGAPYAALVLRGAALLITLVAPQPDPIGVGSMTAEPQIPSPPRDRERLLQLLADPVPEVVSFSWRQGLAAWLRRRTAMALLMTAGYLIERAKGLG